MNFITSFLLSVIALFVIVGPGLFFCTLGDKLFKCLRIGKCDAPEFIILYYLGQCFWSYTIYFSAHYGLPISGFYLVLLGSVLVATSALFIYKERLVGVNLPYPSFGPACLLILALLFGLATLINPQIALGWDAMFYWMNFANGALEVLDLNASGYVSDSLSYAYEKKHPFFLVGYLAWVAVVTEVIGAWDMQAAVWYVPVMMVVLLNLQTPDLRQSGELHKIFILLGFSFIPLVENHHILYGYSELHLAALCLATVYTLEQSKGVIAPSAKFSFFVGLFLIAMMRNTGFIYALTIAGASIHTWFISRCGAFEGEKEKVSKVLTWLALPCALLIMAIISSLVKVLTLGGESFKIEVQPVFRVAENFVHAFFFNQSFSVVFLCFCIVVVHDAIVAIGGQEKVFRSDSRWSLLLLQASCVYILMLLISFQLFTAHGFNNAIPLSDTTGSRFSIVFVMMASGYIIRRLGNLSGSKKSVVVRAI